MFLVDQLVRLLSNPAGSIAYHLVTLFAIQATLAIAFWQWWRKRADGERDVFAWRLMVGAGGMLALRLTLLLITLYLFSMDNALLSLRILPPLEQAVNTATLALIVWALLPAPQSAPQLMNVLVVVLLLLTAFLFAIFTRSWWLIAGSGATYHDSQQTTFFSILQLSLAGGGILWLLFSSRGAYPLRLLVLLVLLLAQLLHFWGYPAGLPATSSIPFWTRLGYLIVLPVLAVIAYRHTLRSLLYDRESRSLPAPMESGRLALAMSMLDARGPSSVAAQAACYAAHEMGADVAAIGLLGIEAGVALTVYSCWPGSERAVNVAGWSADRWPAVGGALAQRRQVALTAGAGDRRIVQEIGASLGVTDLAALVLAPLLRGSLTLGILVVGYRSDNGWHAATWQQHFALCQQFIARAMTNVHAATRLDELPGSGETLAEERANRLATLETERDNAVNEATEARQQAQQALAQLAAERRRANDVATVVETRTQDEAGETRVAELQREIIALRAALREAQRRTAGTVDAGDESGREALINTVNNYAGQLETAWARILELEARAPNGENGFIDGSVATLARNLRTPLTALQGYAELLATSEPATGPRQRQRFLQLLAVDAKRIEDTIGQIEQLAAGAPHQQQGEVVDADSEIETAIDLTLAQIQERRLNLLLEVERGMPSPALRRNELSLILIHLLDNACQASPAGSHVTLVVHMDALQPAGAQEAGNEESFLHLEVRDSGSGIRYQDLPFLFEQQDAGAFSSIAGIGETNVGLVAVNEIVRAGGGRLWAGKAVERGSTYSVLLPIRSSVM